MVCDPRAPFLRADDTGVLRGDGIFERFLIRQGRPRHLDDHLARLERSARVTELAVPGPQEWREAVGLTVESWRGPEEWEMRLVCTRGPEGGGPVTAYTLAQELSERVLRQRANGVALVTLYRSYCAGVQAEEAPWLLLGAKTLSYAVNVAAKRYAQAQGADDAIFVEHDGAVLEGPTSAVVASFGRRLVSPPASLGILDSISTNWLLRAARERGWEVSRSALSVSDLFAADGVWLSSSLNFARAHTLDGKALPVPPAHAEMAELAAQS